MEIYASMPSALRHKTLLYLKNPETDILLAHWREQERPMREDLLVSLNRYNYFRKYRKPIWDTTRGADGKLILFNFDKPIAISLTNKQLYLKYLENGWLLPSGERGFKLRMALFNELDNEFWLYHGRCSNPEVLEHTEYDPLYNKKEIETDFEIQVEDVPHQCASYDEWLKRCAEGGELPIYLRRFVKAPRTKEGKWNQKKASKKIMKMALPQWKRHEWSRWCYSLDDPNKSIRYVERY